MIEEREKIFKIDTINSSYIFFVNESGYLENMHFGVKLPWQDFEALKLKHNAGSGSLVNTDIKRPLFSLDTCPLEFSCTGRGDYRHPPLEIKMPDGTYVNDFIFSGFEITDDCLVSKSGLPFAIKDENESAQTLIITLKDKVSEVFLKLFYTVFEKSGAIFRRSELLNNEKTPLLIRRLMSFNLDLPSSDYFLTTFNGGWIKEAHRDIVNLGAGTYINESITGYSSNRHNPGFILSKSGTTEDFGTAYAFNLIYSGNHYEAVEKSNSGILRIMSGINPHCFEWGLKCGESFETPQGILAFSDKGFNGISEIMGGTVRRNIVRGKHKISARPVLANNWEAHFFDFNYSKLIKLAKDAKKCGVELFVLDDGWFGKRNSDTAGLGDYDVNTKKLKGGLKCLVKKINSLGLKFGLWFEPEMVNENSKLYNEHSDYAVNAPNRPPALGRNQLVLDLCKSEVRDYIVNSVNNVLKSVNIEYVKWDCNRHISDMYSSVNINQGEFFHRQILGLYDILNRITSQNPLVLFESCSSGGNRFDLGMLCYMPQIWCSDDTDPIERLKIQGGLSYLYPQSTFGAHVSMAPHQQTMRQSPLNTRFNVAAFGLLGYELEFKYLTALQKKTIKAQTEFYKQHRDTFQYGQFRRLYTDKDNRVIWQVSTQKEIIIGVFQTLAKASPQNDILYVCNNDIDENCSYVFETKPQNIEIKRFGGLIKHALPLKLNPDGLILRIVNKHYGLNDAVEKYTLSGSALKSGVKLNQPFMGTWYNPTIRLVEGDFASNLYVITKQSQ